MSLARRNPITPGVVALLLSVVGVVPACGSTSDNGGSGGTALASGGVGAEAGGAGSQTGGSAAGSAESLTYVKASNTDAGDLFGVAVALSADGTTLVVGASREGSQAAGVNGDQTDDSAADAGAAYVLIETGGVWQQEAYLKASSSAGGDAFGTTVALSADGNTLAVGAPFESSAADGIDGDENADTANNAGAVYLFVRSGASWQQQAYLKASSSDADDFFGVALSLSADGNVLAVGAEGEDGASSGINGDESDKTAFESGAVYVFQRTGASWQQSDYLKASNADVGDHFGGCVSLSADGGILAVGAYWEDSAANGIDGDQDDDSAQSAGAVYLFGHDGTTWHEDAYLKASANDGNASDNFGTAVSLSADASTLAVGAVGDPSPATGVNADQNGDSMPYAGAVYLFDHDGATWQQAAYLKASNTGAGDEFGYHLHLSADGNVLAVGAALEASASADSPNDDSASEAGAAYVFGRDGASWAERAFLKAPSGDAGDRFGWSVALSAAGDTLAVGATREASASSGIDADQSDDSAAQAGAAYVFQGGALVGEP